MFINPRCHTITGDYVAPLKMQSESCQVQMQLPSNTVRCTFNDASLPSVCVQSRPRLISTRSCAHVCTASESIQGTDLSTQEMAKGHFTNLRKAIWLPSTSRTGTSAGLHGTSHAGPHFH